MADHRSGKPCWGGAAQGEPVGQIWLDPFLGAGERHTGMQKERADPAEREEGTR